MRAPVCVQLCEAVIPVEGVEPNKLSVFHDRVDFVGSSKTQNISILLWNITFEDQGQYICFAKNPKEKNRNHSAIFTLYVVEQSTQKHTLTYTHTHKHQNCPGCSILTVSDATPQFVPLPDFHSVREVDNTLTVIIVSALGGVIGLVILVMVIKAVVLHFLHKDDEKK